MTKAKHWIKIMIYLCLISQFSNIYNLKYVLFNNPNQYLIKVADWKTDQLMFVDESAANEHTANRKYGWVPSS